MAQVYSIVFETSFPCHQERMDDTVATDSSVTRRVSAESVYYIHD